MDIDGFRRGIDSLLIKPINLGELLGRINYYLTETRISEEVGAKEIEGNLSHISLIDLLQILHLNKKEGVLKVFHGEDEGVVYLKGGVIYTLTSIHQEGSLTLCLFYG